MQLSISE